MAFLILFRSSFESDCIDVFDDGASFIYEVEKGQTPTRRRENLPIRRGKRYALKTNFTRLFYSTTLLTGLISLVSSQTTLTFRVKKSGSRRNFVVNF